jgi:hypothetical protein
LATTKSVKKGRAITMTLTIDQSGRLLSLVNQIEALLTEVEVEGAEEILDELYMLVTKVYEQFPALDKDEE